MSFELTKSNVCLVRLKSEIVGVSFKMSRISRGNQEVCRPKLFAPSTH